MKHIPNDHIHTIVKTNFKVLTVINERIKDLKENPSPKNEELVCELRLIRHLIGAQLETR